MGTKEPPITTSRRYHPCYARLGPSVILHFVVADSPKIGARVSRSPCSTFDPLHLARSCLAVFLGFAGPAVH
jgi:hypothetical protein